MNAATGFAPVSQASVDHLGREPVPAAPYYDPAWYADEIEAMFKRNWLEVGHVCEVPEPGSWVRRELEFAGASLLIVRGKDGAVRAFHNVCTHRGTQLVEEAAGRQAKFTCPYHAWTFASDGALLSAPDFESFGLDKADCALKQVRLETCGGLIFVNLDPTARPLREWLAGLADDIDALPCAKATTFSEYTYEIEANWKLTYDNFQENYHLRFIHPKTGLATFSADNPFGYPKRYRFHGVHRTQTVWSNPEPTITPLQRVGIGAAIAAGMKRGIVGGPNDREYFALFPNFFLLGTPAPHFSHTVFPLGPTKSRGVIRLYWVGADASASERFGREYVMASARDIHSEDRAVIAAGQRGLSSGALSHIHFQTQESLCRHLWNGVRDAVEAYRVERAA